MCHPLYHHAVRMVGRPVYAYHVSGRTHYGTLQSVAQHGVYIMPQSPRVRMVNMEQEGVSDFQDANVDVDAQLVFAPAAFFAFGALTGLALASPYYYW
jgi:hypothetical protein